MAWRRLQPADGPDDVAGVAIGEFGAVGDDRDDHRPWRLTPPQAGGDLHDRVQQRHAAAGHREQPADALLRAARGSRCSPRRSSADRPARRGRSDCRPPSASTKSRSPSRIDGMALIDAALLSTSTAMSIGSMARETRRTSRRRPSSVTTKSVGTEAFDGSPRELTALTKSVRSRQPACAWRSAGR